MFRRKATFTSGIDPKTILKILIWFVVLWVFSRPLKGIGENVYFYLGSLMHNAYEGISQSRYSAERLIKAEKLAKKQNKIISSLKIQNGYLFDRNKEMERLRGLIDLKKYISYNTVSASVIGRSSDSWHKQIIINKGSKDKLLVGDSVLSTRGIVGQVVETGKASSVIQLVSDPSYRLGCKIVERNVLGILTGKTNSTGILEFVPIGTDVMVGDSVVTSGISSTDLKPSYPQGHPVGKVINISKKKNKSSDLYIEVKLSENLNSINDVLVFSPN